MHRRLQFERGKNKMKQNKVIKYLQNKINYYYKKYKESGNIDYINAMQYVKNAIYTIKETH